MIDLLITKFVLALFMPALLVVFFTRITYQPIVSLLLSLSLIAASIYVGFTHNWLLYITDALSLTVGFAYARKMTDKKQS